MLVRLKWVGIARIVSEISVFAEAPDYVPVSGSIGIVDLDYPILVAYRLDEISVPRIIGNRVGVKPIVCSRGKEELRRATSLSRAALLIQDRLASDIQVIKGAPVPFHLPIFVQNHKRVANDIYRAWTLDVVHDLLEVT